MIPKIYKEEIFRIWQFFCNIHGIKGLLLRKISQIYFLFFKFSFFFLLGCTTVYFIAKRALDKQSFITKSQALIHGKSLLFFFFLSSLNCITSNKNEKGHSSYIFTITYVYNTWNEYGKTSTAQRWVHFKSHERERVSKEKQTEPKQNKKRGLKALVPHCVGIPHIPSWLFFFLFPVSQQTKFLCLFMLKLFHSWLKFTFGHRSYSACWIQDENPL